MTPMLIIRAAQMQAFSRAVSDNLIESAVEHIRTSLPEMFEQLGREEVRESVLFAMRKADEYGLDDWSQVVRYLNVMYILGFEFDEDPRYAWANEILRSARPDANEKTKLLTEWAVYESSTAHAVPVD